jgi:hypothetical protein
MGHCSGVTCTVLTVSVNFEAKRKENQNLILALCRKFIIEGNSTFVQFKRKEKHSNILFLSKNNVDREPVHIYLHS